MFCPECRRYWKDSELNNDAGSKERKNSNGSGKKSCTVCGTLLARDRMVAEFPVPEQTQQAGRVKDKALTIQDILRETAGPAGAKAQEAFTGQLPLDDRRLPKRRFPFPLENRKEDSESSEPGSNKRRIAALDMVLGFSMLAAILLVIVSLSARALMNQSHHGLGDPKAIMISSKGSVMAQAAAADVARAAVPTPPTPTPTPKAIASLLPASIGSSWKLVESSILSPSSDSSAKKVAIATYHSGDRFVRVWINRLKDTDSAVAYLASLTTEKNADMKSGSLQPFNGTWSSDNALKLFKMDDAANGTSAIATATPGLSLQPHLLVFQTNSDVVTIGADLASDRDSFEKDYAPVIQ